MIKNILAVLAFLFFSGCDADLFNTKKVDTLEKEKQELQTKLKTKQQQIQAELEKEKLSTQAALEKEKLKTQAEIEKARIEKEKQQELEKIRQQSIIEQEKSKNELIRYGFMLLALLMIIAAFFIYLYFKRKREDKLRAYEDNLKKYFLFKENEMKLKLAEKILDTVKEGELSKEDQKKLISIVTAQSDEGDINMIEHK